MQSKTKVFQALSVGALAVSLFAGIIAGFLIFFFLSGCSAKLDHDTPRRVGVPIFDQGIETPDLKAFATSDGGTIWVRCEAATPGDIIYVWDTTTTGKGDLWAFNGSLVLVKLVGSSARNWGTWQASSTLVTVSDTGVTASFLQQLPGTFDLFKQQRHTDGHRLHAEDCRVPGGEAILNSYDFRFDGVTADETIDLLALTHCQDPEHNKLVDYYLLKWVESKE